MTPPPTALSKTESSGLPNVWDILFLTALVCVIAFVSWVGALNYRQGMKTEVTNGSGWTGSPKTAQSAARKVSRWLPVPVA